MHLLPIYRRDHVRGIDVRQIDALDAGPLRQRPRRGNTMITASLNKRVATASLAAAMPVPGVGTGPSHELGNHWLHCSDLNLRGPSVEVPATIAKFVPMRGRSFGIDP